MAFSRMPFSRIPPSSPCPAARPGGAASRSRRSLGYRLVRRYPSSLVQLSSENGVISDPVQIALSPRPRAGTALMTYGLSRTWSS